MSYELQVWITKKSLPNYIFSSGTSHNHSSGNAMWLYLSIQCTHDCFKPYRVVVLLHFIVLFSHSYKVPYKISLLPADKVLSFDYYYFTPLRCCIIITFTFRKLTLLCRRVCYALLKFSCSFPVNSTLFQILYQCQTGNNNPEKLKANHQRTYTYHLIVLYDTQTIRKNCRTTSKHSKSNEGQSCNNQQADRERSSIIQNTTSS